VHISSQASSPGKTLITQKETLESLCKKAAERGRERKRERKRGREKERRRERPKAHDISDKRVTVCARCGVAFVVCFNTKTNFGEKLHRRRAAKTSAEERYTYSVDA